MWGRQDGDRKAHHADDDHREHRVDGRQLLGILTNTNLPDPVRGYKQDGDHQAANDHTYQATWKERSELRASIDYEATTKRKPCRRTGR